MNEVIIKIVENLLGTSIGIVGLIFAGLSILLSIGNENWKFNRLKQSSQYKSFIENVANLAISFMVIFLFSLTILLVKETSFKDSDFFEFVLYFYVFVLFVISTNVIYVFYKFKKLFILLLDNSKPVVTE